MADKCSVNGSWSIKTNNATNCVVKCSGSVTFENYYWYGVRTRCYISGTQVATATGYTTEPYQTTASCTGTKTINKTHSAQTITCKVTSSSETVSGYGGVGESHSTSGTVTIPALQSFSVKYYGNVGSTGDTVTDLPSQQTKWYGEALYLSSGTPSRTGYIFDGWNTNTSGTGTPYTPGQKYSTNSALSLQAQWVEKTGTISYNLTGGEGSISPTSMSYTQQAYITNSVPTLTNYSFSGWSETRYDPGEGTPDYSSGASYKNSNVIPEDVVLYAVWSLAYSGPIISNFKVIRVDDDSSTTEDENGDHAYITFDYYKPKYPVNGELVPYDVGSVTCVFKEVNASSSINISVTKVADHEESGSYSGHTSNSNLLDIFKSYVFTVTLSDTVHPSMPGSTTSQSITIPTSFITLDCGAGGRSLGIGTQAVSGANSNGLLTIGMDADFKNVTVFEGTTTAITQSSSDNTTKIATTEFVHDVVDSFGYSDLFVTDSHLIIASQSIAAGGYAEAQTQISKPGYYPLGMVGWTTGSTRYGSLYHCYINRNTIQAGSCTVHAGIHNVHTSAHTFSLNVHILWIKV